METEPKIFASVGAVVIILGIAFLAWVGALDAQCVDACGIRRAKQIDGACHCATETGWERAEEGP